MRINVAEAEQWAGAPDRAVVDVRSADAFAAGHVPGARNVPELFDYNATTDAAGERALRRKFEGVLGRVGLAGSERVLVYEDTLHTGLGRSCRGYALLAHLGFPAPRILDGGYAAWLSAGLPVRSGTPPVASVRCHPGPADESPMVNASEVAAGIGRSDVVRVDVRSESEWRGITNTPLGYDPSIRLGRLPGARWLPWTDLLEMSESGSRLASPELVLARSAAKGVEPDQTIHLYCYKGARAA